MQAHLTELERENAELSEPTAAPPCIALGTGSPIKVRAVTKAFPGAIIVPCSDVESGVAEQPRGQKETQRGAQNRAASALAAVDRDALQATAASKPCRRPDFAIGIENGMWPAAASGGLQAGEAGADGDAWVDGACLFVLFRGRDGQQEEQQQSRVFWSDTIEIPPVEARVAMGIDPGRNGEWSVLKDPHAVLTKGKRTREAFLYDALRAASAEVLEVAVAAAAAE